MVNSNIAHMYTLALELLLSGDFAIRHYTWQRNTSLDRVIIYSGDQPIFWVTTEYWEQIRAGRSRFIINLDGRIDLDKTEDILAMPEKS